jgi:hypothetical protein
LSCVTNPDSFTFTNDSKIEFEQDGPFVGGTFGWDIRKGYLKGTLAGNFAVAFLDGKVEEELTNIRITRFAALGVGC